MKNALLILAFVFLPYILCAQKVSLTGKIEDNRKHFPLSGGHIVVVNLKDTTLRHFTITGSDGTFLISGLTHGIPYKVLASYVGFRQMTGIIVPAKQNENIGIFSLQEESHLLDEVIVQGQIPPVIQKGDTTEMNASAYKVNPDASTKDLVKKMPGVTVENGIVKAHGEEVKRVLIDGKNYFGDDPSMSLQNLPAEIVDKVQIFNKMSDQAEFTGVDDGQSLKVMNIITRVDRRFGTNGTFAAGSDLQNKYNIAGRYSHSEEQRRLTLITGINNVNQQNFSSRDFQGAMREGTAGLGGGGLMGQREGINTTKAFGINYSDHITKNIILTGSYFLNVQKNVTEKTSDITYFNTGGDTTLFSTQAKSELHSNQSNFSTGNNNNHRFDLRLEYSIDSANSLIWVPRFNSRRNNREAAITQVNYYSPEFPVLNSLSNNSTNGLGYNYSSDLLFKHKFPGKKGRTISLGINLSGNHQDIDGTVLSLSAGQNNKQSSAFIDTSLLNRKSDSKINSTILTSNILYTEPVGQYGLLQLSYKIALTNNKSEKFSFDQNDLPTVLDSGLSNVYNNAFNTHCAGLSYQVRGRNKKLTTTIGIDYQRINLTGVNTFPRSIRTRKAFDNVLPAAMLDYKLSKKINLRMQYRAATNIPSVNQLQDVVTVFNLLSFSQGNSNLKNEFLHNGSLNIRGFNPAKSTSYSIDLRGSYTKNKIGNAIFIMKQDSAILPGDTLKRTGQLQKLINLDESWNTRLFMNYGVLLKSLKCNLSFLGGGGYSVLPSLINNAQNASHQYNLTGGIVIGSNFDENIDFTFSYTAEHTIADLSYKNTIYYPEMNRNLRTRQTSWYHGISFESNFIWEGFTIQNNLTGHINRGLSGGYDQDYLQWNASIGKKLLKGNRGEIKLSMSDILNQNTSITHTVSELSISDSRTNTLGRYYLVMFSYNFRNYKPPSVNLKK